VSLLLLPIVLLASAAALSALDCPIIRFDSAKPGSDCCKVGGRAGRQDPPGAPWRLHSIGDRSPTRGPNTVWTTLPQPKPSFRAVLCVYS
jgi:hypothetical protein